MDHEAGMILWWSLALPSIAALVWLIVTVLRNETKHT